MSLTRKNSINAIVPSYLGYVGLKIEPEKILHLIAFQKNLKNVTLLLLLFRAEYGDISFLLPGYHQNSIFEHEVLKI